jgi:hypothetical protein
MSATTPVRFRLFYVDDSGSHQSGIVVYSWLECDAAAWRDGLQSWLDLRQWLHAHHAIPPDYPLHAAPFAAGRGNPSTDPNWNRRRHLRHQVMRTVLAHLAATDGIGVGTVYRRTTARRDTYANHRADVYQRLVTHLNKRLANQREHGLILTDGDGTDNSYTAAHQSLTTARRHVVEDPQFPRRSKRNPWLQLADLVAWTAYQHLHHADNRRYAWHWYEQYLTTCDVQGGPAEI